jgi:cellulose biosynthesis protein BcsQ
MTTSTEQDTASIRFYRDGTVTADIPGVENRPIRGVDSVGAHRMVRERLLQAAAALGRPLEVTAEEANGEVWAFVVDPTLGAAGEVRDERLVTEARPTPGWLPATELPEPPAADDMPEDGEVVAVPSRPAPPRLPSIPDVLASSAPPVAPPVTPRGFDADPRPQLPGRRDLVDTRPQARGGPATMGWQGAAESLLGWAGWHPAPSRQEKAHRHELRIIQRPLTSAKLIVVADPAGGVGKSSLTLALAAMIGRRQSRGVLAWDLNPNKGTLGMRTRASEEQEEITAEQLLAALPSFEAGRPRSELDNYVRPQGEQRFEVLAAPRKSHRERDADDGDETAWMRTEAGWVIGWEEFHRLYPWLASYYRLIVADTGNKQDPVWWAAMSRAHQLVIPISLSEHAIDVMVDTCEDLEEAGFGHLLRNAVTVINSPAGVRGREARRQRERVHRFFGPAGDRAGRTRVVLEVPFDAALALGKQIDFARMSGPSLRAHQRVAAAAMERL